MRRKLTIITIVLLAVVFCSPQSFSQTGKWTQLFPKHSPPPRSGHGMAYLGDDKILVFGGWKLGIGTLGDTWIYDLSDNEWTEVKCDSSPKPRDLPAMAQIAEGKALFFGGDLDPGYTDDTWLFDLGTMKWRELQPKRKPYRRARAVCTSCGDNKILLYSGDGCPLNYSVYEDGYCHDTWIFDLEKNEWDSITNNYPRGRVGAQMCEVDNDRIVLYGGWTSVMGNPDVFIFNINNQKWKLFIPKINNLYRDYSSMVKLVQNTAFVFGGCTFEGSLIDDSWILDMDDSTWIELSINQKPQARYYHNMAKIAEGKVLLFGGAIKGDALNDTWLFEYDPTGVKDSSNLLIAQVTVINKSGISQINITNLSEGQLEIELYDLNGNLVKNLYSNYNIQKEFEFEFSTAELQTNAYFFIVKTKYANYYKQILVVH